MKTKYLLCSVVTLLCISSLKLYSQLLYPELNVFSNATPATPSFSDTTSWSLGLRFYSSTFGGATGIRFYKGGTNNDGVHTGALWDNLGNNLASVTFSNETDSGWQTAHFTQPVILTTNTPYVVSYVAPNGYYSLNKNAFTGSGSNSPPLYAFQSGIDGSNGLYIAATSNAFPNLSVDDDNYWVDVQYNAETNIFTTQTPVVTSESDAGAYTLGMRFYSDVNGLVTGVRFYKGGTNNGGVHIGKLWSAVEGVYATNLASVTFSNETSSGWQTARFSTPVQIYADQMYIVSYNDPQGHYSYSGGYFSATNTDNGYLHATRSSLGLLYGTNGCYNTSQTAYPYKGSSASPNYWVDVLFVPDGNGIPGDSAPAAGSYVMPGTVGFLGDTNSLTVYTFLNTNVFPPNCSWTAAGLRCNQSSWTLTNVWIIGGIYWAGNNGDLVISNSIIQGYYGQQCVQATGTNITINIADSTLNWATNYGTYPTNGDNAVVTASNTNMAPLSQTILRCDLGAGLPQGYHPGPNTVLSNCWIHGLYEPYPFSPGDAHIDAIYSLGGDNELIQGCYVELSTNLTSWSTANLFIQAQSGGRPTNINILANCFVGGQYGIKNQNGIGVTLENNTFVPVPGEAYYYDPGLYGTNGLPANPGTFQAISQNTDTNGNIILYPSWSPNQN